MLHYVHPQLPRVPHPLRPHLPRPDGRAILHQRQDVSRSREPPWLHRHYGRLPRRHDAAVRCHCPRSARHCRHRLARRRGKPRARRQQELGAAHRGDHRVVHLICRAGFHRWYTPECRRCLLRVPHPRPRPCRRLWRLSPAADSQGRDSFRQPYVRDRAARGDSSCRPACPALPADDARAVSAPTVPFSPLRTCDRCSPRPCRDRCDNSGTCPASKWCPPALPRRLRWPTSEVAKLPDRWLSIRLPICLPIPLPVASSRISRPSSPLWPPSSLLPHLACH
mmetsp:Transcript_4180/g.9131  ORF Transcript_4180/g.9131 Transcript_4180/m.9131 type:complete len:280 (+) Transcript_4180:1093-1932(+)